MSDFDPSDFNNFQGAPENPALLSHIARGYTTDAGTYLSTRIDQARNDFIAVSGIKAVHYWMEKNRETSPLLSAEDANKEFGVAGHLTFDEPVRRSYAELLHKQKSDQLRREDLLSHSPGGAVWFTGGVLGVGMSFVDPGNLALVVIPGVGEARYVQLASKLGKIGARAVTGTVNAGIGGVAIQPLIKHVANEEQNAYTMADSLRSVGLMAFVGGALHVGFGAFGDWRTGRAIKSSLNSLRPETRLEMVRAGMADALEGRPIESPAKIAALDENAHLHEAAQNPEIAAKYPDVAAEVQAEYTPKEFEFWNMTKREVRDYFGVEHPTEVNLAANDPEFKNLTKAEQQARLAEGVKVRTESAQQAGLDEVHQAQVQAALDKGLKVPPEVLKEFEALKAKVEAGPQRVEVPAQSRTEALELRKQSMRDEVRTKAEETRGKALEKLQADQLAKFHEVPKTQPLPESPKVKAASEHISDAAHDPEVAERAAFLKEQTDEFVKDFKESFTEGERAQLERFDEDIARFKKDRKAWKIAADCYMRGAL